MAKDQRDHLPTCSLGPGGATRSFRSMQLSITWGSQAFCLAPSRGQLCSQRRPCRRRCSRGPLLSRLPTARSTLAVAHVARADDARTDLRSGQGELVAAGYDGGATGPIASEMSTPGETFADSREPTIWVTMGSVVDAGNWPGSPYTTT